MICTCPLSMLDTLDCTHVSTLVDVLVCPSQHFRPSERFVSRRLGAQASVRKGFWRQQAWRTVYSLSRRRVLEWPAGSTSSTTWCKRRRSPASGSSFLQDPGKVLDSGFGAQGLGLRV